MSQQPVLQDTESDQDEHKIPIKQSGSSGIAALLRTTKSAGLLKQNGKNGQSMTSIDRDNGTANDDVTVGNHTTKVFIPARRHGNIQRIQSVPCDIPLYSSHPPGGRAPLNSVPSNLYAKSGSTSSASSGDNAVGKKQALLPPSQGYQNGRQSSTSKVSSSVFSSVSDDHSEMSHEGSHDFKEISPDRASQESSLSDCFIEEDEQYPDHFEQDEDGSTANSFSLVVTDNSPNNKKQPMLPPVKTPPTKPHKPVTTSHSVSSTSSESSSANIIVVTSKPVPKPRFPKASTSGDLNTSKSSGDSSDVINRDIPPGTVNTVTTATTNERSTERERSTECGISPPARDLKFENEVLKHQILHLKEQQTKLESENSKLREQQERSRGSAMDSDVHWTASSVPNSKSNFVTAHPRPRSRSVSPVDVRESDQSDLRRSLDDIVLPSARPVPIPRDRGLKSTADISSSVPTKTFLARSREATPANMTTPTSGGAYQRQSSNKDAGSQSPVPKPRARPLYPPSQVSKSPSPSSINEKGSESKVTITTTSESGRDMKTDSQVTPEKALAVQMLQKLLPKQALQPSASSHVQVKGTKPVPVPRIVGQKATPPVAISNDEVDGSVLESRNKSEVKVQHSLSSTKQSSSNNPSAPVSSTEDKSLTPPDVSTSSSNKGVNSNSPKPIRGVLYKKMAIKSDASWIKPRKPSTNEDTPDAPPLAPPKDTPTSKPVTSVTNSNKTSPPKKPAPYRSHAILSGTSAPSSSLLNSGTFYSKPTTSNTALGGSPTSVTKETKVPPPKIVSSRKRTETISGSRKEKEFRKSDKRRHSFTRSASDDSISSGVSESHSSKVKGFLGAKTKSEAKTKAPKKPPRPWLGRGRQEELGRRPVSMLDTSNPSNNRVPDFTSSCMVSTIPRGTDPDEMKDQKTQSPRNRRKQASDSNLLESRSTEKSSKGKFGFFKGKQKLALAPPLEEVDESDSSSDDEKGGTIKYMPKLRHVSVKKSTSIDDDDEPEYNQLFEYVFVVALEEVSKGKLTTKMTYTFPPATCPFSGKDAALQSIPQFCFPDIEQWKPTKSYQSESFSFVLTDIEGHRRFGYCRRLLPDGSKSRLPECYCIVSPLGCFSLYENILDHVEKRRAVSSMAVFTFLKAIVANPFPRPGRSVQVRPFSADGKGLETLEFGRPMDSRLEHVSFSLLFSTLSQRKVIKLFSSLLMERRVIFCAHSLSLLSGCAHALMALLYPFEWQHVFIPVLPSSLIDFVCSPLPYIIGISPACIKQIDTMETMEEAVIIDLDKKKFIRQIGDEASILPSKLFQYLEHSLSSSAISSEYSKKSSAKKAATSRADEIVVNTFMKFFAYLYGDYKSHMMLLNPTTRAREFQRSDFIQTFSSKSTRRFLEAFHRTQMFEEFIEQRENPSKAENTAQSLFERRLPELKERCEEIEIFSSKSRFDRWKMKKGLKK